MRTMTADQITALHAARTAKGDGYTPPLPECIDAAREGRLYDIDTASSGHDGLEIGDDADDVLASWADACGCGSIRGWSAERIELSEEPDHEPRVALHNDPSRPTYVHEMTAEEVALCHRNVDLMDDDIRNALDGAGDDDRAWLALYAARHEAAHGTPWCLP